MYFYVYIIQAVLQPERRFKNSWCTWHSFEWRAGEYLTCSTCFSSHYVSPSPMSLLSPNTIYHPPPSLFAIKYRAARVIHKRKGTQCKTIGFAQNSNNSSDSMKEYFIKLHYFCRNFLGQQLEIIRFLHFHFWMGKKWMIIILIVSSSSSWKIKWFLWQSRFPPPPLGTTFFKIKLIHTLHFLPGRGNWGAFQFERKPVCDPTLTRKRREKRPQKKSGPLCLVHGETGGAQG